MRASGSNSFMPRRTIALLAVALAFAAVSSLSVRSVEAPDTAAGRADQYVTSAGAATLYIELYDSVSDEILAHAVAIRRMQDYGMAHWASSVSNRADANRMFKRWTTLLRQAMDEVRQEAGLEPIKHD